MIYNREENARSILEGLCWNCNNKNTITLTEQWHGNRLYNIGTCTICKYDHHIIKKNITLR